jgi:hypothetical protein
MKRTISLIFASMIVVLGLSAVSFGQTRYGTKWGVNRREHRQQVRISQGIRSGRLTPGEAYRLEHRESRINRQEARFRRSGNGLSTWERRRLQHELNGSSRQIYRQKHDRQGYRY